MPYERVPTQAEMYLSYLLATREERIQGTLLPKLKCQTRFETGRIKRRESQKHPYADYERRILNSLRIRLVEID